MLKGIEQPNIKHPQIQRFTVMDGHKFRLPRQEHVDLSLFQAKMMNSVKKNRQEEIKAAEL